MDGAAAVTFYPPHFLGWLLSKVLTVTARVAVSDALLDSIVIHFESGTDSGHGSHDEPPDDDEPDGPIIG